MGYLGVGQADRRAGRAEPASVAAEGLRDLRCSGAAPLKVLLRRDASFVSQP
jgi:hypothetical protein